MKKSNDKQEPPEDYEKMLNEYLKKIGEIESKESFEKRRLISPAYNAPNTN